MTRDSIWCLEHRIEVSYVRERITDEDRLQGYMYPEEFIGWYWVDPRTGEAVEWERDASLLTDPVGV